MSKARQRQVSAYSSGWQDALTGYGFRWKRHPQIGAYRKGYLAGRVERKRRERMQRPGGRLAVLLKILERSRWLRW